ncbi:hypothetical protein RS030_213347 [Cryptosporidium xiaoi]|uniref:GRIP domain-containing protein n=1 Tax=Cryptosporidium xiaoi TaxID=659607 RepID=A0AAV9XYG8_9CRYT
MRAAWGALKGAVQELNDALLEDETEIQIDAEKIHSETKYNNEYSKKNNNGNDLDFSYSKKNNNFYLGSDDKDNLELDHTLNVPFHINGDSLVSSGISTDSIPGTINETKSKNGDDRFKFRDKSTNVLKTKYSDESDLGSEEEMNKEAIKGDEFDEIDDNRSSKDIIDERNSEDEEEPIIGNDNELELINSEDGSLSYSTEKDDYSIGTEELEYNESGNSRINNENDVSDGNLPRKHVIELEKIFQMEIKTIDDLCRILEGYYSDWKGIRNDLINNKELILKLAPTHYESYLRETLFDIRKPFSLGFTVLLGQCILSFVNEIDQINCKISDKESNISKLIENNDELNNLIKKNEIEISENLKHISELSSTINSLKEENKRLEFNLEDKTNRKSEIDIKRIEELENERNNLIKNLNDMISEKENTKDELDKLHEHINNLTSIIEGYQTEEDQINSRYEIELEKARTNERKLISRLNELDSFQKEVENMKVQTEKLNEEKNILEKSISELKENNKNLFDSNEEMIKQIKSIKNEQKEYMIDKRFILQLIQKYHEEDSRPRYRNDLFDLLCDAIGIPEDEKLRYLACDHRNKKKPESNSGEPSQNLGFADMFYNFLNSEIERNT